MNEQTVWSWEQSLRVFFRRVGQHFKRAEPREWAYRYVQGLLSNVPRKNGWRLAEQAGEETPDGMQRLLGNAVWDEEAVRDKVCQYVWSNTWERHRGASRG